MECRLFVFVSVVSERLQPFVAYTCFLLDIYWIIPQNGTNLKEAGVTTKRQKGGKKYEEERTTENRTVENNEGKKGRIGKRR